MITMMMQIVSMINVFVYTYAYNIYIYIYIYVEYQMHLRRIFDRQSAAAEDVCAAALAAAQAQSPTGCPGRARA